MSMIDALESRRLMAVTAKLSSKGTLTVTGTDAADVVAIDRSGNVYQVTSHSGSETMVVTMSVAFKDVKRINVNALGGDDKITIGQGVDATTSVYGGNGDDTIDAYSGPKLLIDGGTGNDRLRHISSLTYTATRLRYATATKSGDTASLPTAVVGQNVTGSDGTTFVFYRGATARLVGGSGNDILSTGFAGDTLDGGAGSNDKLVSLSTGLVVKTKLPLTVDDNGNALGDPPNIYSLGNESFSVNASGIQGTTFTVPASQFVIPK